jgi:hypothetical protein
MNRKLYDFSSFSDEALDDAITEITRMSEDLLAEKNNRRTARKTELWENVLNAIHEYTKEFGDIGVYTGHCEKALNTNYYEIGFFDTDNEDDYY